jgi:tRNA (adenine22-N1)-methyltransferase
VREPRLSARLRVVPALIPRQARSIADVGAGHGALSARLATTGAFKVIAIEAQPGPFAELCRNLLAWQVRDRLDVRYGRGVDVLLPGEADVVVVAGVSARTALEVCGEAASKSVRWMVVQCVQGQGQVEPWFAERAWIVLTRVDVEQRHKRYPTWLAEVPT